MTAAVETDRLLHDLTVGELEIVGRLTAASNTTLLCRVETAQGPRQCVYKPVRGERPLWDFPAATITGREIAAYELDRALGWGVVPPTGWRADGPAGAGMCQLWIDEDPGAPMVGVVAADDVPPGWLVVLEAQDRAGSPVALVHADVDALRRIALFDVLANNADRKGGHVLVDAAGRAWGIDHGVTFSAEDKLRTVLWGWTGTPVPTELLESVAELDRALRPGYEAIDRWLAPQERAALRGRVDALLSARRFPEPGEGWPPIPWPVM